MAIILGKSIRAFLVRSLAVVTVVLTYAFGNIGTQVLSVAGISALGATVTATSANATAATADDVAFTGFGHIAATAADATAGATGGKGGERKLSRALVAVKARCCTAEGDARCGSYPAIRKWVARPHHCAMKSGRSSGKGPSSAIIFFECRPPSTASTSS